MSDSEVPGELRFSPSPNGTRWLVTYQVGDRVIYSDKIDLFANKARRRFVTAALKDPKHPEFDSMLERLQEEAGKQTNRTIAAQERVVKAAEKRQAQAQAEFAEAQAAAAAAGEDPPDEDEFLDEMDKVDKVSPTSGVRAQLVDLVLNESGMEVFMNSTSADADAYVTHVTADRRVTWAVKSAEFKRWLLRAYKKKYGDVPSTTDLTDGIHAIGAIPDENTPTHEVFVRVAPHDGETWIDLGDDIGRAIRVTSPDYSPRPRLKWISGPNCA